ncbi:hypothetical protein PgNI_06528, partial [Pyricularia grisea]|uniref:Uncharacterized protein n=1 Tax=Pyricularia grisea TaxID=148305 RepID=A0A6P8B3J4_PYRGI
VAWGLQFQRLIICRHIVALHRTNSPVVSNIVSFKISIDRAGKHGSLPCCLNATSCNKINHVLKALEGALGNIHLQARPTEA